MEYCSGCGNEIGENDKFCRYCGKNLAKDILGQANDHYNLLSSMLKDLQPIAFFISALLVLAGFLRDDPLHQKYALFASVSFFLAYLGLAVYNITRHKIFLYWGSVLILIGIQYIYNSFGGIVSIISNVDDKNFQFTILSVIVSTIIVIIRSASDFSNKFSNKNNLYKLNNIVFWVGVILTYLFVYANVYLNINIMWMYFGLLISFASFFISTLNIDPTTAINWLEKLGLLKSDTEGKIIWKL